MNDLKEKLIGATYSFNLCGLAIKSKINKVFISDDKTLIIFFNGGCCDVYKDCIEEIEKSGYKWCYKLKNYLGDELGYIGR